MLTRQRVQEDLPERKTKYTPRQDWFLVLTSLSLNDMDVIESNEAFAAQACSVSAQLGLAPERVNPNGGAIALGHPIGASGAIITTKLVYDMARRGAKIGAATMCIGGGQGIALILENLSSRGTQ